MSNIKKVLFKLSNKTRFIKYSMICKGVNNSHGLWNLNHLEVATFRPSMEPFDIFTDKLRHSTLKQREICCSLSWPNVAYIKTPVIFAHPSTPFKTPVYLIITLWLSANAFFFLPPTIINTNKPAGSKSTGKSKIKEAFVQHSKGH